MAGHGAYRIGIQVDEPWIRIRMIGQRRSLPRPPVRLRPARHRQIKERKAAAGNKGPAFEISAKADNELNDGATATEAVARIATLKSQGQPFFLAVGFLKPHLPFIAPKKYWDLYDPDQIRGPETDTLPKGTAPFVGHTNGELHSYAGVPRAIRSRMITPRRCVTATMPVLATPMLRSAECLMHLINMV